MKIDENYLFEKFLKNPPQAHDYAAAKFIFSTWPRKKFWAFFQIEFKLNSLWWFKSPEGRRLVTQNYNAFKASEVAQDEITFDILVDKPAPEATFKPKTLKDFIDGKKKRK